MKSSRKSRLYNIDNNMDMSLHNHSYATQTQRLFLSFLPQISAQSAGAYP
jgi:hypothetical protein